MTAPKSPRRKKVVSEPNNDTARDVAASILHTVADRLGPAQPSRVAPESPKYVGGSSRRDAGISTPVASVPARRNVVIGKPTRSRTASSIRFGYGASTGLGNTVMSGQNDFYSATLSTDFLQLPQSQAEEWALYRHFYENHPIVGQAIDLQTELPLSKVRLNRPKAINRAMADAAQRFCEKWCTRVNLLQRLYAITHQYNLLGIACIMVEDNNPDMPESLMYEEVAVETSDVGEDGKPIIAYEQRIREPDEKTVAWMKKNYKGWTAIRCLPPEQVRVQSFNFTEEEIVEYFIDDETKKIVEMSLSDPNAKRIVNSMPKDVVAAVHKGENVFLNTDPDAGSFIYIMKNSRDDYSPHPVSKLKRCVRALVHEDKLRQANASIASRHMTPHRLVWAENLSEIDIEILREQVDQSIMDPDYSLVTNFQVNWEELGSDQRLLDLSSEMDLLYRQFYAGLGVTESLLTGEGSYSGDRVSLEVINQRFMNLRENLQSFVDENIFKPMCRRMGFIELDEDGNEQVIYPGLSFTRLPTRDNQDTFNAMYNLYTKGSLDIDTILEMLNIDPVTTKEKIMRDLMDPNDSTFNEVMRNLYSGVGNTLAEKSNAIYIIAQKLGLQYEPGEDAPRF